MHLINAEHEIGLLTRLQIPSGLRRVFVQFCKSVVCKSERISGDGLEVVESVRKERAGRTGSQVEVAELSRRGRAEWRPSEVPGPLPLDEMRIALLRSCPVDR